MQPLTTEQSDLQDTAKEGTLSREAFVERMESTPETGAKPEPDAADVTLADALNKEPETAKAEAETLSKPKTLNELAETLDLEIEDLYKLSFTLADGSDATTHTVGELKDVLAEVSGYEARQAEYEETKVQQENELLRARQEMQTILQSLPPGALNADILAKAEKVRSNHMRAEADFLAKAIPEWKDEAVETKERAAITFQLMEYGMSESSLDNILDHRVIKYMRDNMLRKQRMDEALKLVKPKKAKAATAPSKPAARKRQVTIPVEPANSPTQLRDRFKNLG